jgi:hypothetical protein
MKLKELAFGLGRCKKYVFFLARISGFMTRYQRVTTHNNICGLDYMYPAPYDEYTGDVTTGTIEPGQ